MFTNYNNPQLLNYLYLSEIHKYVPLYTESPLYIRNLQVGLNFTISRVYLLYNKNIAGSLIWLDSRPVK